MFEGGNACNMSFLSLMKASQAVSLFSVGFPSANYHAPLLIPPSFILPHPWSHSVFITCCYLSSRSALKSIMGKRKLQNKGAHFLCVVVSESAASACSMWSAVQGFSPPVNRTDSGAHLTQDQLAIMVLSPEGWSHCPQSATQEGEHMAVVMRLYTAYRE